MELKFYTGSNREAWNEVMPIHRQGRTEDLHGLFKIPGYSVLDKLITEQFRKLGGLQGKDVAQLCCNNGIELLSIVNTGARSGTGFDISDAAIEEATALAELASSSCTFIRTDVYDIDVDQYRDHFDLVYISIGALTWLPDLQRFFAIASGMLRRDGKLVIYDMHPFLNMLATEDEQVYEDPLKIAYSYFRKEPWVGQTGIDYIGHTSYDSKTNYSFSHPLSDIMNGICRNGMIVTQFDEYSHDISNLFQHLDGEQQKLPICYILVGQKT